MQLSSRVVGWGGRPTTHPFATAHARMGHGLGVSPAASGSKVIKTELEARLEEQGLGVYSYGTATFIDGQVRQVSVLGNYFSCA